MKVLLVDDQRSARRVLRDMLRTLEDLEIAEADSLALAKDLISSGAPDLLLVDIRLSETSIDRSGLELLRWLRETGRQIPAVMITASSELAEIREAMRHGAQDYVLKDELCPEMLLPIVEGLRERFQLRGEVSQLRKRVERVWGTAQIVGSSPQMERVRRLVDRVANADSPVLIRGETGSGKEMVARAIHEMSGRNSQRFLAVNCSALPGTLVESLIFGHERGAFTGASRRVRGQLELAGAGTLLLDEIAEMPSELQAKLLRVLEDRTFRPLGSEEELPLRARVLAATHVDLESRMRRGQFREDLFYRLNVVSIELPTLAERQEDLNELVHWFVEEIPRKLRFSEAAMDWLSKRSWPGNVRELKNTIERLALLADTTDIDVPILKDLVGEDADRSRMELDNLAKAILALPGRFGSKLEVVERAVLEQAVATCGGNKSAAARLIGLDRKALERKWERLGESFTPPTDE
ncbi:MAG TPA: sigma-54 dependent transcriptional regulator [Polyangiaceae bacterium]|nr:sigma-54 dependent transcriptional regulator [Polyangiaceae bacterium]